MLPDYPKIKGRIAEMFGERIKLVHDLHMGTFSRVPSALMHEGDNNILLREDGSVQDSLPKRISSSWELPGEFEKLSLADIDKLLIQLGEGLAKEKLKMVVQAIEEACRKVGNVTDPSKPPVEQFFESFEKRQIEFDDEGRLVESQFLVGSEETAEKLGKIMEVIATTHELKRRYDDMIERKRSDWRDREAARKLVD